ncbi:TetR/AcrR family transcriptional regulator [Mangrovihabitans endophyticus]|uniref:TetR family transcriptional regulator n=1 Tax=Mangrovihabitans endophyticus TaxID=1751298 RepID=A0A8J3C5L8_9ACTN|nr:TetR/AcrR family transcriptional regulator [Mangrovihabitans endophyticus]GGL10566.1 TetR family transcriptional regulator [Mangrovihabitans endophyticus]
MTGRLPHMLRSDAQENRDRVLDAARSLFSEHGLDVPIREIARRAGVGPATLYRRFPTKQALIDLAFAREVKQCREIVRNAWADEDPWRGMCSVVNGLAEINAQNQGFVDAFMTASPDAIDFAAHRADMLRMIAELCRRAKHAGALRPDFVLDDFILVLMVGRGLSAAPPDVRRTAARRFSALTLDALRASPTTATLPPPVRVTPAVLANWGGGRPI